MSRSRAETWLTTRSPIRIDPEVGVSRPAIMRNAVVLPQPEEPTRIMNSPSATSSESSSTAAVVAPGNRLLTCSKLTWGMSLDPGEGDRADEPALSEQEDGQHRDLAHHRARHEEVPLRVVCALQGRQPQLQRGVARGVDDDQRPEEVVPGPHELD